MARFIPAQIKAWTGGELLQTDRSRENIENFYRGISTDTRDLRPGELFLALRGENFDGHDFIPQAIQQGAACLVVEKNSNVGRQFVRDFDRKSGLPDVLLVEDSLVAYGQIAAGYRQTLLASVIAITGSVGKTTTRRMVSELISRQVCTHETVKNQNNLVGVPLTLLEASDDDDVIVAELGVDRPGEIKRLSEISRPDIAILTSIGYSHAAYLGSRENILKEKTDITYGMKANGLILINGQDDALCNWAAETETGLSIWSISNEPPQDDRYDRLPSFWAENVVLTQNSTGFEAHNDLDPAEVLHVTIPAPGKYLVRAALFALASAYALGLDMQQAALDCGKFHNTGNRQNIIELGDLLLVDDSYNASPESVISGLETLELLGQTRTRTVACLAGIRELGKYTEELHRHIADWLLEHPVDQLFLVGPEMDYLAQGLRDAASDIPFRSYDSTDQLIQNLDGQLRAGDIILLKGSRFYQMEKVHDALSQGTIRLGQ